MGENIAIMGSRHGGFCNLGNPGWGVRKAKLWLGREKKKKKTWVEEDVLILLLLVTINFAWV